MIIKSIQRSCRRCRFASRCESGAQSGTRGKINRIVEPFILHNEHDFVADNVEKLAQALVPEERAAFGYDASLSTVEYWIEIHIPALRRWTYP